ncbi:MAG: chloride channel protein [Ghiorsea sp.]|nr:chloride channel protein [Ghiorsea sp.]
MAPKWLRSHDTLYLGLLALVVGVLAGYGALLVRFGIEWVSRIWTGEGTWSEALHEIHWSIFLLAPVLGGLLVGWINIRWLPQSEERVIPGVIEALAERGGKISARKMTGEFVSNIVSVGSGASMGREAPTVALGASLASLLGQWFGLSEKQMRTMLGCGVAAGIAASFNAPIAGVLFALEVILADYAIATFTPIVMSAVIATVITRSELGNFPMFTIPEFRLVSSWEIPAYIGLGIFCGLLAAVMVKSLPKSRALFESYVSQPMFRPAVAGLLLGLCALVIPEIMSIGYGTVDGILLENVETNILGSNLPLAVFLGVLLVMKMLTSVICSGGRFGGGMIGPSLFVGATAGALYGGIVHGIFPTWSESYGAYALVACGAMLAATVQAPMSSILMIFELSNDYHIMVPLMTACVVAALVKRSFGSGSVITEGLQEKGVDTEGALERSWMRAVPVSRLPWRSIPSVHISAKLEELKQVYISSGKGCVVVVNDEGEMHGIVTFEDLKAWLLDSASDQVVVASEVANTHVYCLSENDSLLDAVDILDQEAFEQMPVVAKDNPKKVLGIVSRNAVFSTYHKLIVKHGEENAKSW